MGARCLGCWERLNRLEPATSLQPPRVFHPIDGVGIVQCDGTLCSGTPELPCRQDPSRCRNEPSTVLQPGVLRCHHRNSTAEHYDDSPPGRRYVEASLKSGSQ